MERPNPKESAGQQPRVPWNSPTAQELNKLMPEGYTISTRAGAHLRSGSRRPAGCKLKTSGLCELNVEATEGLVNLAGNVEKLATYGVLFAGSAEKQEIVGRLITAGEGLTPISYDPKRRTAKLYLHGLFKDLPALRPTVATRVSVSFRPEPDGGYILIQLGAATRMGAHPNMGPGQQQASGEKKPTT